MLDKIEKVLLIVDNDITSLKSKVDFLSQLGYSIETTNSGVKASESVASNHHISLVLMDINLNKDMTGIQTAKQMLDNKSLPILFHIPSQTENPATMVSEIAHYGLVSRTASPYILQSNIESAVHLFEARQTYEQQMYELRQSQYFYRLLMNNVQEGVILVDEHDRILFVNTHFCSLLGYKEEELVGIIGYRLLVRPDDRECLLQRNTNRVQGISEQYELTMLKKTGEPIIFFMNASPVYDEQGKFTGSMATCLDITKRKQAEEKAHETEKMLRLILDTLPVSVFIKDKDLRYLDCNHAFAQDAGIKHTSDIIGKSDFDLIWKEQADLYRTLGKKVIAENKPKLNIEEPQNSPSGKKKWVKTNLIPLQSENGECIGLLGTYEDITERIDAQNKLRHSEITYRGIINSIEEVIYIQDDKGRFLDVNNTVETLYGFPKEYFIGKTPEFLSAEGKNNLPEIAKAVKKAYHGEAQQFEFWAQRKDGSIFPKEVSLSAGSYFGQKAVIAVARNISERKEKEKQIIRLLKEKEVLLQEVHHRIKNNMNIISSLLSLQIKSSRDKQVITALQDAQSRVQSMMVLYDKLYRTTHFKNLSCRDFLTSLIDEILSIFPNYGAIQVEKEFDDFDLEEKKISSLGIIIGELLTNAMKYAYQETEKGRLKIALKSRQRIVKLIIEDNGKGLPLDFNLTQSGGFGLKLVHLLAQQLNGNFAYERLTKGTKFLLEFSL